MPAEETQKNIVTYSEARRFLDAVFWNLITRVQTMNQTGHALIGYSLIGGRPHYTGGDTAQPNVIAIAVRCLMGAWVGAITELVRHTLPKRDRSAVRSIARTRFHSKTGTIGRAYSNPKFRPKHDPKQLHGKKRSHAKGRYWPKQSRRGRPTKYWTKEDRLAARRRQAREAYWRSRVRTGTRRSPQSAARHREYEAARKSAARAARRQVAAMKFARGGPRDTRRNHRPDYYYLPPHPRVRRTARQVAAWGYSKPGKKTDPGRPSLDPVTATILRTIRAQRRIIRGRNRYWRSVRRLTTQILGRGVGRPRGS